jgi:hypothetical protein
MSAFEQRSRRKSGDHVVATIAPANRLAEPRFGLLDGAIIVVFLLCATTLVYLILG